MPTDIKKRGRIIRWGVRILAVLVVLFMVTSVVFYGLARSATSRWEQLASELRAKGQPLTYAEIEATRPEITDESNGEVAIREAIQILESINEPDESGVLFLDSECETNFYNGIDLRCLPPTREYVDARRQALAKLSELTRYADVRLNVSYKGTMFDTQVLNILTRHRALGKLVNLVTILNIIDSDISDAVDAIVLQLRLSEPLYTEPSNLMQLVAIAGDWFAVTAFERLLQSHELGDDELKRLQLEWNRHVKHQSLQPALLGERASFIRLTDIDWLMADAQAFVAAAEVPPKKRWKIPNPVDWIGDWFIYENRIQGVTILTRLLDTSDDISGLLTVARQEQATISQFGLGRIIIRGMLPSLIPSIELHARSIALSRCVTVAIAAERFRLTNGRFPKAAEVLVPDYLSELPRDPFDGKPIRFAKIDSGIVIYSIGENTIDDGGQVVPEKGERFGRDFGVRLVEPKERKLLIIDNAEQEDK